MVFKKGQKVNYYDHRDHEIKSGTIENPENQSSRDEEETLLVSEDRFNIISQICKDWIFSNYKEANDFLKKQLKREIKHFETKVKYLKNKLDNINKEKK